MHLMQTGASQLYPSPLYLPSRSSSSKPLSVLGTAMASFGKRIGFESSNSGPLTTEDSQ
jgi:hypothetical protein